MIAPEIAVPAALLGIALTLGCAHHPPAHPPVPPGPDPSGRSGFTFVPDPTAPARDSDPGLEFVSPAPLSLPKPAYPVTALRSGCGALSIGLRITVDEEGRVSLIEDSPLLPRPAGACAERLREAAVEAVREWRFRPACWRHLSPGDDYDGDGEPDFHYVTTVRNTSVYLDVRIDFEVEQRPEGERLRTS